MSNRTFIAIVIFILLMFAFIYTGIPSSADKSVTEEMVSSKTVSSAKSVVNFDDFTDITSTTEAPYSKKTTNNKKKVTINSYPSTSKTQTTKRKIVVNFPNTPKTTTTKKTIVISIPDEKPTTTKAESSKIKVIWECDGTEKDYIIFVRAGTIITEDLVLDKLIRDGYQDIEITEGADVFDKPAEEKEYTIKLNVKSPT